MRIKSISKLINNKEAIVADIGSDHAFLAINLLKNKQAKFVYNIEINQKPLESGIKNLINENLIKQTKNIINDGLKNLTLCSQIDYAVIAGMGGNKAIEIISNTNKQKVIQWILVVNNNADKLRAFLSENYFKIVYEELIVDKNHYYFLMQVIKNEQIITLDEREIYFGPYLLKVFDQQQKNYYLNRLTYLQQNNLANKNTKLEKEKRLIENEIKKIL